jgi:hypothetical protein
VRIRLSRFLGLALAIGLVAPLFAQPGRFGGNRGMDASALLGQKSVQEEIKLTEDQVAKVEKIGKDLREKYADQLKDAGKDKDKRTEITKKMGEERTKLLADVLKPDQAKRVKQIEVQVNGLTAFTHEDVQKALKLTDKQISDLKEMEDAIAKDRTEMFKDAGKDKDKFAEVMTKIRTLNKEAAAKFVSKLTDDQKKAYKELAGDEFKGKIEAPTFGRPGKDKKGDKEEE